MSAGGRPNAFPDKIVNTCIRVLSALDMFEVSQPHAFVGLYNEVFGQSAAVANDVSAGQGEGARLFPQHQVDMVVRLKICLHWAITNEREGSQRALVVCKLFTLRILHCRQRGLEPFAGFRLQEVLVDFISHDTPRLDSDCYKREYANLMLLFLELQHFKLFDHDLYVRSKRSLTVECALLRPPALRAAHHADHAEGGRPEAGESVAHEERGERGARAAPVHAQAVPGRRAHLFRALHRAVAAARPAEGTQSGGQVSAEQLPPPTSSFSPWKERQSSSDDSLEEPDRKDEQAWLLTDPSLQDEHEFLERPRELSVHERFLIQLPIEQLEPNREARNQRLTILHGRSADCEAAKAHSNQVAADICKIWHKRNCYQFKMGSAEFAHRSRAKAADECAEFRRLSYYDQLVVAGRCADNFMAVVYEFVEQKATHLPTAEGLEVICEMFEECTYVRGILDLAHEVS